LAKVNFRVEYLHLNLPAITVFTDASVDAAEEIFNLFFFFGMSYQEILFHLYVWH